MSEFTPINTQEEFNEAIKERLERADKKWADKYANYFSPDDVEEKTKELTNQINELNTALNKANDDAGTLNTSISEKDSKIAELELALKAHETNSVKIRIANEVGLPFELVDKISGEDEEAMRADAKKMAEFIGARNIAQPLRDPEAKKVDGVVAAFMEKNPNLFRN